MYEEVSFRAEETCRKIVVTFKVVPVVANRSCCGDWRVWTRLLLNVLKIITHGAKKDNIGFSIVGGLVDHHGRRLYRVSNYCANELCKIVAEEWEKGSSLDGWSKRWEIALCKAYERADNAFKDEVLAPKSVGTTALVLIVSPCQIIAANCGDSRAVLCRGTQTIPLTVDHKPDREDELERITSSGGRILNWGCLRVEGILSMSRAIGDHDLKPWVISVPEVTFMTRTDEDECLILASDGLWDVLSNEEVVRLARKELRQQRQDVRDSFKRDARKGKGEPTNIGDDETILANNKVASNPRNFRVYMIILI
ncbi:hypothetical protein V6N13_063155 [Hibiscus sabdariffa]